MANQAAQGLLSPLLQRHRLAAARPHVEGKVLDIGCGDGALTALCRPDSYFGFDLNPEAVARARSMRPGFQFANNLPDSGETFDSVIALAVIEHVPDPAGTLRLWSPYMARGGKMVLTTPLPALEWAHELGSKLGIFSHEAAEEHETLIDRDAMGEIAGAAGLEIVFFRKFLGGANQLFVLKRRQQ